MYVCTYLDQKINFITQLNIPYFVFVTFFKPLSYLKNNILHCDTPNFFLFIYYYLLLSKRRYNRKNSIISFWSLKSKNNHQI